MNLDKFPGSWVKDATCAKSRYKRSDLWFVEPDRSKHALILCARCPVLKQCREWTLKDYVQVSRSVGVVAGLTQGEIRALRKGEAAYACSKCGFSSTIRGVERHIGEYHRHSSITALAVDSGSAP